METHSPIYSISSVAGQMLIGVKNVRNKLVGRYEHIQARTHLKCSSLYGFADKYNFTFSLQHQFQGHAAATAVRLREKASGEPKFVPSADMSAVPRIHGTTDHTVQCRTQHLLQLSTRPTVLRRQQVSAVRPEAARYAQRGTGDDSARPVLSLSLQRRRMSLEVKYERH